MTVISDWIHAHTVADERASATVRTYLAIDGARRVEVELVTLGAERVICVVQREVQLSCAVGDTVTLSLVHPGLGLDHAVEARLVSRAEQPAGATLAFALVDPAALASALHPGVARAFDRRAAIRVRAEGPVTLVPPKGARVGLEVGALVDLSVGGLAVDVPATFEEGLVGLTALECLFRLPGEDQPRTVAARVRHRTLQGDGRVRYGLMFADTEDGRLEATRDAIVAWLARRTQ